MLIALYLYGRWIASGDFTPVPKGADTPPTYMTVSVWVHQVLLCAAALGFIWWYIVRPWRRERRVTTEGLLVLACMTAFWQDLLSNYAHYWVIYNTEWFNMGSWYNHIPGFERGGELMAEPLLTFLPAYAAAYFGCSGLAVGTMRWAQSRRPHISKLGLVGVAFLTMALFDFVLEIFWVRLGVFIYPSTIPSLTLWSGELYQFPIYESIIWGAGWAAMACLRFFRDDRGRTFVERGVDTLGVSEPRKTALRFCALAGAANVFLLAYNLVAGSLAPLGTDWPEHVADKSYFRTELCTPDTTYLCPDGMLPEVTGNN